MEEELLQGMIRDRETQIKLIEGKLEEQKKKMERVQLARVEVTNLHQSQKVEYTKDWEAHMRQYKVVLRDYRASKDSLDMKKQQQQQALGGAAVSSAASSQSSSVVSGPGLHVYNDIMKSVATSPESNDSSYVLRMQAQLCKAMHSMGMMETQLQTTTAQQEQTQKAMKDVITAMVEEKSQIELQLMNDLVMADVGRQEVETKVKDQAEAFIKEKDVLMEKIERQNEPENSDEEQEEDDEEEKEELQEILTQGREEMERLEKENKEQQEELDALKEKVAQAQGQDIADEIVTSIAEEFKERLEEEKGTDDDDDSDEDD
ncbi:MAG: hypothetical protein SGARI_006367 [Bacillariaceae sp.]